jgi:L-lactate utilization protein LutB
MPDEATPQERRNDLLAAKVVKNLTQRHFDAHYCKTATEAAERILSLIPADDTVSWGGSMTLQALGVIERLKAGSNPILDRNSAKTPEEKTEITRKAMLADTYLAGVNAVSEDGQLVHIDGNGNRVAAIAFGPRNVILVAGINKVVKSLDDALSRARNYAAPINVQRFPNLITGCKATGSCCDCILPESICTYIVTTRISHPAGRIKVILIGEHLGY